MLFFPQLILTSSLSHMNLLNIKKLAAALTVACSLTGVVHAATITIPNPLGAYGRQASLDSAESGFFGTGNPNAGTIAGYFGGVWTQAGELTGNGNNGLFTVQVTSGSWGASAPVSGTWAIDSSFWTTYGVAVISMHVGGGAPGDINEPDHFAWLVTPGELSGTWNYIQNLGNGGGLSNIKLWGSGEPTRVPDSASTLALIGLGLAGLGVVARYRKA